MRSGGPRRRGWKFRHERTSLGCFRHFRRWFSRRRPEHGLQWQSTCGAMDRREWNAGSWHPSGGTNSYAYGVSADGSVVIGYSESLNHSFRWTVADGMQDLGTLPGGNALYARGDSADGSVVVGYGLASNGLNHAFRWTAASGMQDLGTLPGETASYAYGVSADGSVVVGSNTGSGGSTRAFRWTVAGGMQDIGSLPGRNASEAFGVSGNGLVVVGRSSDGTTYHAFRWSIPPPPCRADFDNNGTLSVQDIFDFLSAWFASNPARISMASAGSPSRTSSTFSRRGSRDVD